MRTTLRPTTIQSVLSDQFAMEELRAVPVRRALIFSTELVLGPAEGIWSAKKFFFPVTPSCIENGLMVSSSETILGAKNEKRGLGADTYQWYR
jgi:hypothetical protein